MQDIKQAKRIADFFRREHRHKDCDNEERPPGRTSRNWKSYRQYWKDEGRQAFETYAYRVEKEGKNKETVVP
jgi:hypothetical protein